jgi:hypothetical protein
MGTRIWYKAKKNVKSEYDSFLFEDKKSLQTTFSAMAIIIINNNNNNNNNVIKIKVISACRGSWSKDPCILHLRPRQRSVICFTPRPVY